MNKEINWISPFQKEIVKVITDIKGMHLNQQGSQSTVWCSSSEDLKNYQFLDLHREQSGKSLALVRILVFSNTGKKETEVNLKIELYLNSYCTWDTFFEGWITSIDNLKTILQSVGLLT